MASTTKRLGSVPQVLLNAGFIFALVLAGVCLLITAIYLYSFLRGTTTGIDPIVQALQKSPTTGSLEVIINGRLVMARLSLLSCGIFVGVSFGFLGFALYLLGVKESIDVDIETDNYKAKFARMSPGVLVIICSSILTGFCATRQTPFWYEKTVESPASKQLDGNNPTDGPADSQPNDQRKDRSLPDRSKEFSEGRP